MSDGAAAGAVRRRRAPGCALLFFPVLALMLATHAVPVAAQTMQMLPDRAVLETLACLQPAPGALPAIAYPREELRLKQGATVRVRLAFSRPDAEPDATFFFNQGGPAFNDAVLDRVKRYRLPCLRMPRDQPFVLTQEFYFDPRDGRPVTWNVPAAKNSGVPKNQCVQTTTTKIEFPPYAQRGGTMLASIEMASAQAQPKVVVLNEQASWRLASSVREHLEAAQYSCTRYPATMVQEFRFTWSDEPRYALDDMPLARFVSLIDQVERYKVRFDCRTMACPFDVQLSLWQPYLENKVGEVGSPDPNRSDFLDWLGAVALRLPPESLQRVLGQEVRISVPCGLLDLRD